MTEPRATAETDNETLERGFPEEHPSQDDEASGERVVIFAPTGRDGRLTCEVLQRAQLDCLSCENLDGFCREIAGGAGVAMLAEEALAAPAAAHVLRVLEAQPPWSDLPLIIFNGGASSGDPSLEALKARGNVTLLDRPVRIATLVSTVLSALRARRRQYEVRDLLRRLEMEARRKDEFLAMLGHELRNPLAAASNALAVLQQLPDAGALAVRQVSVLDRQIHNLRRMVDDLLDVSRVSMGKIHLRQSSLDLREIARNACEAVRSAAEASRHTLSMHLPAHPVPVQGDPLRLEQVVTNLLTNAVKYTPPGGHINLELEVAEVDELPSAPHSGRWAALRVRDTGMGIPREMLTHIFDLFTQAHTSDERTGGGLGLGLTLVRGLVALHGGTITAASDGRGRGTEFVVHLPVTAAGTAAEVSPAWDEDGAAGPEPTQRYPAGPEGAIPAAFEPHPGRPRVLVIEDNADGRETMRDLLEIWGYEVEVAEDGEHGVERAIARRPEVALVDIGLPGIDGYQAARLIRRALDGFCPRLIAMTGYGQPEDRARAEEAGFDAYLVKPVDPEQLSTLLHPETAR